MVTDGGYEVQLKDSSWKKVLTQRDEKQLMFLVDENQLRAQQELLQSINESLSQPVIERTLRRKLQAINIFIRAICKRHLLAPSHKVARLKWAKKPNVD